MDLHMRAFSMAATQLRQVKNVAVLEPACTLVVGVSFLACRLSWQLKPNSKITTECGAALCELFKVTETEPMHCAFAITAATSDCERELGGRQRGEFVSSCVLNSCSVGCLLASDALNTPCIHCRATMHRFTSTSPCALAVIFIMSNTGITGNCVPILTHRPRMAFVDSTAIIAPDPLQNCVHSSKFSIAKVPPYNPGTIVATVSRRNLRV